MHIAISSRCPQIRSGRTFSHLGGGYEEKLRIFRDHAAGATLDPDAERFPEVGAGICQVSCARAMMLQLQQVKRSSLLVEDYVIECLEEDGEGPFLAESSERLK